MNSFQYRLNASQDDKTQTQTKSQYSHEHTHIHTHRDTPSSSYHDWMLEPTAEMKENASSLMLCSHVQTQTLETRQDAIHCEFNLKDMLVPASTTQRLKRPPSRATGERFHLMYSEYPLTRESNNTDTTYPACFDSTVKQKLFSFPQHHKRTNGGKADSHGQQPPNVLRYNF